MLYAQQTFNHRIDYHGYPEFGWSVTVEQDSNFTIMSGYMDTLHGPGPLYQGLLFDRFDVNGNLILQKKLITDSAVLFPGLSHSFKKAGDSTYFLGGTIQKPNGDAQGYWVLYNHQGDTIRTHEFGGSHVDAFYNCTQTYDKGYALVGQTKSLGDTIGDIWLVKLDSDGNFLWQKTYGSPGIQEIGNTILEDTAKNLVIGAFAVTFNSDPVFVKTDSAGNQVTYLKWTSGAKSACGGNNVPAGNGNYYQYGCVDSTLVNGHAAYPSVVHKLDANFNIVWSAYFSNPGINAIYNLTVNADSSIVFVGLVDESINLAIPYGWIVKLDRNGNVLWQHEYYIDSAEQNYMADVEQTPDKGFIITGMVTGNGTTSQDTWLIRLDSNGCLQNNCGYVAPTGIIEIMQDSITMNIYPNPVINELHLLYHLPLSADDGQLEIRNILGETVFSKKILSGTHDENVDLSNLPDGIYIISVISSEQQITRKIVKQE